MKRGSKTNKCEKDGKKLILLDDVTKSGSGIMIKNPVLWGLERKTKIYFLKSKKRGFGKAGHEAKEYCSSGCPRKIRTDWCFGKIKRGKKMKLGKRYLFLGALLAVVLLIAACNKEKTQENSSVSETEETKQTSVEFPYKLDDGKLEVESVFQYSGMNPDCEDEEGDDIAAIQLKNCSDEYLQSAECTVIVENGTELTFSVEGLPAGSTVMAFEVENKEFAAGQTIKNIETEASYSAEASLCEETIEISVDDSQISLKNMTAETVQNMTVTYHCILDDVYFGGKSYQKKVESLGVGESITVDASECYLGEAAVVKIAY